MVSHSHVAGFCIFAGQAIIIRDTTISSDNYEFASYLLSEDAFTAHPTTRKRRKEIHSAAECCRTACRHFTNNCVFRADSFLSWLWVVRTIEIWDGMRSYFWSLGFVLGTPAPGSGMKYAVGMDRLVKIVHGVSGLLSPGPFGQLFLAFGRAF